MMTGSKDAAQTTKRHLPILQGVLPYYRARVPADILGGVTLAALGILEVMGYDRRADVRRLVATFPWR